MGEKDSKVKFLSLISSLITVFTFVFTAASAISYIMLHYTFLLYLLIFFAALFFGVSFFHKNIAKKLMAVFMNLTAPDKKCEIVSEDIVYEYKSLKEMSFTCEFQIKPLHDGLESFSDKYKWTGTQNPVPEAIVDTHTIKLVDVRYGYQRYKIVFGDKNYNKHDPPVRTGVAFKSMKDPDMKASKHLSTGIYDVTKFLKLEVQFPMDLNPTNIRKLEYIHFTDEEHYRCINENSPETDRKFNKKVIRWSIPNPIYGGKYMIDWDFC